MTAQARIPTDSTGWRAMDIFVFTNGQQYSPPRKYHLDAQELNRWNAILSFLAKSQYGSQHSIIDLYTVNGKKLEGPLQLSNGTAYVAVKPPDIFIDTGYSKYLVKATRSWEKSQARRCSSNEITKPDDYIITTITPNIETSTNKEIEGIPVTNTISPDSEVIEKPHTVLNIHEYPQKDSSAIYKQQDKKRISPIQRFSILRKAVTTIPPTRKDSGKSKDVSKNSKSPLKVNQKALKENGGNIVKTKMPSKHDKRTSAIKPNEVGLKETEAPLFSNYSNGKIIVVDKSDDECLREKDDSLIVSNILKSADSEIPSIGTPFTAVNNAEDHNILININEELSSNVTKITTDTFNNEVKSDLPENPLTLSNVGNNLSNEILNLPEMQKAPNVSFAEKSDQTCYVINNGDIVNLKLQIEVRSSGGAVSMKSKKEQRNYSSANIVKLEKESQIDLDSDMSQNKSLQSMFMSKWIENADKKSGLIVIKCSCYQEKDYYNLSKTNIETLLKDNKMYVILMPSPEPGIHLERCRCDNKILDITKTDSRQTHKSSLINLVKKTASTIALEILKNFEEASKSTTQELYNADNNACPSKVDECLKTESETKPHVATIEKDIINHKRIDKIISKTNNIDNVDCGSIVDRTKILTECKETSNKITQTELCSLLVSFFRSVLNHYYF